MRQFLVLLVRNPVSLLGVAVTTAAGVLIVSLFTFEALGYLGNPYLGILTYLILPAIFVVGLLLIPVGIARERRRLRRAVDTGAATPVQRFPVLDLNKSHVRNAFLLVVFLTAVNVVILSTATFKGVEVMESVEFCGTTCHTVMQPEHTAHGRSPHSRVTCVECHIGPGAGWFVKSKLSGAWQVVSVAFDLYPRPIPSPVHNLRPARDTCEQCHWPTKFVGDRLMVRTGYADDETVTEQKTVLLLRVGGLEGRRSSGIHWHVDPDVQIRYRSDESREEIYDVELTSADGTVKVFHQEGNPASDPADGVWRVMDCVDCHNRPTHIYELPGHAVDLAIEEGRISRELPFVRREAVRLLEQDYASHDAARSALATGLTEYYRDNYPEVATQQADAIQAAGRELGAIFANNVFPQMNVAWGTYPDHIGHEASPGCFRCHNDEHSTPEGETISQDCDTCHSVLAWAEEEPAILAELDQR